MPDADPPPDPFASARPGPPFTPTTEDAPDSPASWREPVAAVFTAALFDLLIYRTGGYAAAGLLFLGLIPAWAFGSPFRGMNVRGFACVAVLLGLTAARLMWLGWGGAVGAGAVLLVALGLARAGRRVWVLDLPVQFVQTFPAAPAAAIALRRLFDRGPSPPESDIGESKIAPEPAAGPLSVLLPAAATATFAGLFLLANPDLRAAAADLLANLSERVAAAVSWAVPGPVQAFLWAVAAGVTLGTLRPLVRGSLLDPLAELEAAAAARRRSAGPGRSAAYPAVRNTLSAVVALFAAYLPYEFLTLWRRDFPEGFYYAGFAHEGAAWLTVALAAATVLLSACFRGSLLADPRLPSLRRLAWGWSALNFLLVLAAVNRLLIYVDYNGLSRLRIVGFLGIAAVACGFAVCVAKIAGDRGFTWLVRHQLRAAALVVLVGLLLPVDWVAHRYNASRVAAGDPAPLALIAHHQIDTGGLLALEPVLFADDATAARGVAGLIARRASDLPGRTPHGPLERLSAYQFAEDAFRRMHARNEHRIESLLSDTNPAAAVAELKAYAWRWW